MSEQLISEAELHDRLDEFYDGEIRDNITPHEYPIVGAVSAIIEVSDGGIDLFDPRGTFNRVSSAYRLGGVHINVIDRADDVIDGERGFSSVEDPTRFLNNWREMMKTGEIPEQIENNSERVAYEAIVAMRETMSEDAIQDYAEIFDQVVEHEMSLAGEELEGEEEYLTHLESAGLCYEALAVPMADNTGFPLEKRDQLYEIGRYFQVVDDLQDIDEDNYFENLNDEQTWDKMRSYQEEIRPEIGSGMSRRAMTIFGTWMPEIDRVVDFKKYV